MIFLITSSKFWAVINSLISSTSPFHFDWHKTAIRQTIGTFNNKSHINQLHQGVNYTVSLLYRSFHDPSVRSANTQLLLKALMALNDITSSLLPSCWAISIFSANGDQKNSYCLCLPNLDFTGFLAKLSKFFYLKNDASHMPPRITTSFSTIFTPSSDYFLPFSHCAAASGSRITHK